MKHRVLALTLVLLIALSVPLPSAALANPQAPDEIERPSAPIAPDVTAASVMLIDAKTGDVLWRKNASQRRPVASTTKMMTGIVAIEQGNLEDTVTVRASAIGPGRFHGIRLAENEQLKLRNLLYATLVYSANDAATAIADHIGGSVDSFADMMNAKAAALGAADTHFTNPHGLDEPMHYSTAHDLAIIARYALQNSTFSQISGTREWHLARSNAKLPSKIKSTNKLLSYYPGATGGKTGYVRRAGNCLVSSATRGEVSLVCVVLGAKNRKTLFAESSALLDFGFSLYENRKLIHKDTTYAMSVSSYSQEIEMVAAEDTFAVVRNYVPVSVKTWHLPDIDTPVKKGTVLGRIFAYQDGRVVASSDLIAKEDVEKPTFGQYVTYYWMQSISSLPSEASLLTDIAPPAIPQAS